MARSRTSSPAPSPYKKLKTAHTPSADPASIGHSKTGDYASRFAPGTFDIKNVDALHEVYAESEPYKHAVMERLLDPELLEKVKNECLSELSFTEKETDIYKVHQTGDLASLSYLDEVQIARLPALLAARDALYSSDFRAFLRSVTGCGPLSSTKQDMSVNTYRRGCHLLTHDDVIGTRRVSYILYMPLPNTTPWPEEWGGALELYDTQPGQSEGDAPEPKSAPCKIIPPAWNQFVFFEVQPGHSFHSVQEVVVGEGEEDERQRLSISGWFHAAQPGEEGYEPETAPELKSSREQLTSTSTAFTTYPDTDTADDPTPLPDIPLSSEHISFLSAFLDPVYLQQRTLAGLGKQFVERSEIQLHHFLAQPLAERLRSVLRDADVADKLTADARNDAVPPHTSGIAPGSEWTVRGPPHTRRYCTLTPHASTEHAAAPGVGVGALANGSNSKGKAPAKETAGEALRTLQDDLFTSAAFRAWLACVAKVIPMRHAVEARRFRPGLDYTLATSEAGEARLDTVLGLTPGGEEHSGDDNVEPDENEKKEGPKWTDGDWGGWECYMAPHGEEDDPAVYRSGPGKRQANDNDELAANGQTISAADDGAIDDGEVDAEDEDEDEDDAMLLSAHPAFNSLLLVLRDAGVMHFVKYVSAAADGSRWDVCGEFEIGVLEKENDEGEMEE